MRKIWHAIALKSRQQIWMTAIALLILTVLLMSVLQHQDRTVRKDMQRQVKPEAVTLSKEDMVILQDYIPQIEIDLIYATDQNIYGRKIYDNNVAWLRRGTADKLKAAQAECSQRGYTIKVWDAYRTPQAQFKLWEAMPDARYVVDPNQGFSYHSRGVALDLTLVDQDGQELLMPSVFDDLSQRANRDYRGIDPLAIANAKLLEKIMLKHGFLSIYYEWWHFADAERDQYGVVDQSMLDK
jgi:D-alanyl-D-alanine dipeptidase